MKPIDYIYKNLDSFNISIFKQIVEESGEEVSESIYDYLMETTWNTNPALLKQFGLDIERSSEDESDESNEWTTIRLEKMELTIGGQSQSILGTNKPDDLVKMRELMGLLINNGHPIIKMDYDVDYDSENHKAINIVSLAMTVQGMFGITDFSQSIALIYDYNNTAGAGEFIGFDGHSPTETNYIKLYYKIGDYYTIFINDGDIRIPVYVEPNSSYTLQDMSSDKYYSDGTNKYYNGDTIHFIDGMTLTPGYDE